MFGSEVIEVGIGMALLFLFVSLIATALQEGLEGILQLRGKDLERGIRELLHDSALPTSTSRIGNAIRHFLGGEWVQGGQAAPGDVVKALYGHPLICSLYPGRYRPGSRELPSYIPSSSFSLALLDIVARGSDANNAGAAQGGSAMTVEGLRQTINNIGQPQLQRAVLAALDTAGDDIDKARATIEAWYDGTMDQVSGWYRRRAQGVLFTIGLAAAIVLNIDAVTVAQRLSRDKSLREAVVKQAEQVAKTDPSKEHLSVDQLSGTLSRIGYPIGWARASLWGRRCWSTWRGSTRLG